jgi:hypothetical protein
MEQFDAGRMFWYRLRHAGKGLRDRVRGIRPVCRIPKWGANSARRKDEFNMLSMMQPIRTDDIAGIDSLKSNKVFLLRGVADDDIVVKLEGKDITDRRPLANSVMKAIDPQARVKTLEMSELQAIKDFVESYSDYVEALHLVPLSEKAVKELKQNFGYAEYSNPAYWTKMEKLQLRNLDSTLSIPNDADRDTALDQFAKALSRNNGLAKLGEVVAADAFIGNTDRFMASGGVPPYLGPVTSQGYKYNIKLKCLQNVGNVFIALNPESGKYQPSPVDYIDPHTCWEKFQPLGPSEAANGQWPGRALLTKEKRVEYAEKIVEDLERLLNPRGRRRLVPMLGFKAASQIEEGMVSGARKIYTKLGEKFNNKPMPEAVRERVLLFADIF